MIELLNIKWKTFSIYLLLIHFCRTAYFQESCDVFIFSSLMVQSSQKQGFWPFIANFIFIANDCVFVSVKVQTVALSNKPFPVI